MKGSANKRQVRGYSHKVSRNDSYR